MARVPPSFGSVRNLQESPVAWGSQTSIITEGFRSLGEGEEVEFYVETGDDGRTKAVQVTGPNGAPPVVRQPNRPT
jgi:hypothetical protein